MVNRQSRWITTALAALVATSVTCGRDIDDKPPVTPTIHSSPEQDAGVWTRASVIPADVRRINDVKCVTEERCIAAGQDREQGGVLLVTINGGEAWELREQSTEPREIGNLACLSEVVCIASSGGVLGRGEEYLSRDGGETWALLPLPHGMNLDAVSCAEQFCLASDGSGYESSLYVSTDGTTWNPIDRTGSLAERATQIDCASSTRCWLTQGGPTFGGRILFSADQGVTWSDRTPDGDTGFPAAIHCSSDDSCWWGGVAFIASSQDAGRTWDVMQLAPTGVFDVEDVTCVDQGSECFAASSSGVLAVSAGEAPQAVPIANGTSRDAFEAVDCKGRLCIAVGSDSAGPTILLHWAGLEERGRVPW